MIKRENGCVQCSAAGLHCLGSSCPNESITIIYCDDCEDEIEDEVYEVDGEELCEYCLKARFRREW